VQEKFMSSKRIWKYILRLTDKQTLVVPANAEPLSAQVQDGEICVWVLVDLDMPLNDVEFYIYGTGNQLPEFIGNYISTCQLDGFVWHVFVN
jgi:hypothetical protein